jgi:hypothetical protein
MPYGGGEHRCFLLSVTKNLQKLSLIKFYANFILQTDLRGVKIRQKNVKDDGLQRNSVDKVTRGLHIAKNSSSTTLNTTWFLY